MVRDLAPGGLDAASRAFAAGRVRCDGVVVAWEPELMASWVRHDGEAAARVVEIRDRTTYTVDPADSGSSPA